MNVKYGRSLMTQYFQKHQVVGILIRVSARVHDLFKKWVACSYLIQDTQTLRDNLVRALIWLMKKKKKISTQIYVRVV